MCIFYFILGFWNEKQTAKAASVLMTSCSGLSEMFYMFKGTLCHFGEENPTQNFNTKTFQ